MPYPLRIENLEKSFHGQTVLGPINLHLAAGTITAIIGRSGCGKTTLLRCLGGLEPPSAGSITIGDGQVTARDIGYVFQEPRLMPWLDVAQNTDFGLGGLSKSARDLAVSEALDLVGLPHAGRLLPKQLSGGMAQRVALARALAPHPKLILLDEPFSALDPFTREQMQDHLLHLHAHYGATMVLITHDMDEALALAHRVIVLDGPPGHVIGDFATELPRPADRTSTSFFGWKRRLTSLLSLRHKTRTSMEAVSAQDQIHTNDPTPNNPAPPVTIPSRAPTAQKHR
jgi:sulfonate transport system ATP-binding protein